MRMIARVVHVVSMLALGVIGCGIIGGALTPADATVVGIPWAVLATITMMKSGWYFCD